MMKDGLASRTARSVAARRLTYERIPADYGDPAADLALSRDVAAGLEPAPGRMHDYIRARTAFFDRIVISALDSGMPQVVVGAAGYDGRSLRYAKPGVRWFEVDHPATQADKLERLRRLGVDAGHVRFVAADFRADPVAAALREAGLDVLEAGVVPVRGDRRLPRPAGHRVGPHPVPRGHRPRQRAGHQRLGDLGGRPD